MDMLNMLDPIHAIVRLILRKFYKADLSEGDQSFVKQNTSKHRWVLWANLVTACLVFWGLWTHTGPEAENPLQISDLLTSMLAPVMVMGTAWFSISFGGIPAKLIDVAMSITFWMFLSFTVSLTTMLIAVCFATAPMFWPIFVAGYLGAVISCIQYDTTDGLKAGLDEAVLNHSRAALLYYEQQGIEPTKKTAPE